MATTTLGEPGWVRETRGFATRDLGSATWVSGLVTAVSHAADDDLGTLLVARSAFEKAATDRDAELARQRAAHAAQLERDRQRAEANARAEQERERERDRARAAAATLQRERQQAEVARQEERARVERARTKQATAQSWRESVMPMYGYGLIASVLYSLYAATSLQGYWGGLGLSSAGPIDRTMTIEESVGQAWEYGWPILLTCLASMAIALLLDWNAAEYLRGTWRMLTVPAGLLAGLIGWSASNPYVMPWAVGIGWMLGALIELVTSPRLRA
ncbi:hypothetical protein [Microbacterium sp. CH-015]|uniref:hypothetical protein n=1 Tax=Microbacterium sp. CH-015 TaxID=3406734 RepID=UPI003C7814DD